MHWLVDGNNLMHLLPEIIWGASDEARPAALAAALKPYRDLKKLQLTIVFDGGESQRHARLSGLPVIFSGPEKSADQIIVERLQKAAPGSLGLISNDQELAGAARRLGAQVIRADSLAVKLRAEGTDDPEVSAWNFSTRKKGPSRRMPKAQRRRNSLLGKF